MQTSSVKQTSTNTPAARLTAFPHAASCQTLSAHVNKGQFRKNRLPSPLTYYPSEGIKLSRAGEWRDAICPFHPDSKPSLRINVESGAYKCMVCGASGGDVLAFHRKRHGLAFIAAAKDLGAWEALSGCLPAQNETPKQAAERILWKALAMGFKLIALHTYRDESGNVLFWRLRLKHSKTGEKCIRPMRQLANGTYELKEPEAGENGKSLYGLENLATDRQGTVVICEGESCADALKQIGLIALTSGGAASVDKSNWEPLRGRKVLIWPDYDDAGKTYSKAVSWKLQSLACAIAIVETHSLGLERKGDAVDWLAIHKDASALTVLGLPATIVHSTGAPAITEACAITNLIDEPEIAAEFKFEGGNFFLKDDGIWFYYPERPSIWVASWMHVKAYVRDSDSSQW